MDTLKVKVKEVKKLLTILWKIEMKLKENPFQEKLLNSSLHKNKTFRKKIIHYIFIFIYIMEEPFKEYALQIIDTGKKSMREYGYM